MSTLAWLLFVLWAGAGLAQDDLGPTTGGVEIATGLRGTLSTARVAVMVPQLAPHFDLRAGVMAMSATTWATFHNHRTGALVSAHPVVLGGTVYFGGSGPLKKDLVRTYGGFELLVGHSFTPYDDAYYKSGNRIGPNVTLGMWGTFGFELLATEHQAVFVDGGGGFKTYRGLEDEDAPIAVGTAWLGSGATVLVGTRLYL